MLGIKIAGVMVQRLNFEGKDDLKSKITADIAKKLEEIFEDEPMEDLIQIVLMIVSNKYLWGKDGAKDELTQVVDDEDQVNTLLEWLENQLPVLYERYNTTGGPIPPSQKPTASPKLQEKKDEKKVPEKQAPQPAAPRTKQSNAQIVEEKEASNLHKRVPEKKIVLDLNRRDREDILTKIKPQNKTSEVKPPRKGPNTFKISEQKEVNPKLIEAAAGAKYRKRCKFFPGCKNEDCEFVHPSVQCEKFPKCLFGPECLYLHPEIPCKYGAKCMRFNCSYSHNLTGGSQLNSSDNFGAYVTNRQPENSLQEVNN